MSDTEKSEVETLADQTVELIWTSLEKTGWDEERALAWIEKVMFDKPDLSAAIIGLSSEDQREVTILVLRELAARQAPRA